MTIIQILKKTLFILSIILIYNSISAQNKNSLRVNGTSFELNGRQFEYTGISFFNAIYNPTFNQSGEIQKEYLQKFKNTGINVLRIWCQYDNSRGFADGGSDKTLYSNDGSLKPEWLNQLKKIIKNADEEEMVILLVLFSRESWNENIRLNDDASDKAVATITNELQSYRNVVFQIWNEFDYRAVDYLKLIKSIDPERLVTNSPGYGGFLGRDEENRLMDFLSPHTSRNDLNHWEIAAKEIQKLILQYHKPVVDDEPARKGTPKFGGPKSPTNSTDHILHLYNVWKTGGYVIYHHDMFQTGYGTEAVPSNAIPLPGHSSYHDQVFDFLKNKDRYLHEIRPQ